MIKKFVKKPRYINAVQWTGDNTEEVQNFIGETCKVIEHVTFDDYYHMKGRKVTKILECKNPLPLRYESDEINLEDTTITCYVNDWVVFDNEKNFYFVMSNKEIESSYNDITTIL